MNKRTRPFHSRTRIDRPKIKPGADARLGKIFSGIGVPSKTPFVPDRFQVEAVAAAGKGDCLVTAPTGSGKTWIAEQTIADFFQGGKRSWYASPLKALSNSKYMEFSEIFGRENVGILTGDRKENPEAAIIIGTTEVLRNQLYDAMHQGCALPFDFVVLDEAHFLGDEDRGVVWEEIIIYLPQRIPLLLLSATIGNPDQIARWMQSIRSKQCAVIGEYKRPVPLFPLFFHPTGTLYPLMSMSEDKTHRVMDKKVSEFLSAGRPLSLAPFNRLPQFGEILKVMRKYRLLPAIFFLKSRADCDAALNLCTQNLILNPTKNEKRHSRLEELIESVPHVAAHRQIDHLKQLAVGAHHSGHLPAWKLILEKLMSEGLLDAIFATSTVAAGVNFPARSIVLLNSDRFNGREFLPLDATQFHQMSGRAGRRGMDKIGFAIIVPGKFMDARHLAKLTRMPPSPVNSQIRINFSMALNLLLSHAPDQIEDLLYKSFAAFQIREKRKSGKKGDAPAGGYLVDDFNRHLAFLREKEFVSETGALTGDGVWASQLRVDQPLMIAEGFRKNAFPTDDPALLAGAIAVFVNEQETDDRMDPQFAPNKLVKMFRQMKKKLKPLSDSLIKNRFDVRPYCLRPMATVYAWAAGHAWDKVRDFSEMEDGDLAMLILRTADNLRHIVGLADYFPESADSARQALDLILKEPVIFSPHPGLPPSSGKGIQGKGFS